MSSWRSMLTAALLAAHGAPSLLPDVEPPPASMKSGESRVPTKVRFVNETSADVQLYWVDFQGEKQLEGTILPSTAREVQTYVTHVWVATDAQGRTLGVFAPDGKATEAKIQRLLQPKGADREAALRSKESKARATVRFVNRSPGLVRLYWLDYDGKRNLRARVEPGHQETLKTFATHPWIAVDERDQELALFVARPGESTALITAPKGTP